MPTVLVPNTIIPLYSDNGTIQEIFIHYIIIITDQENYYLKTFYCTKFACIIVTFKVVYISKGITGLDNGK